MLATACASTFKNCGQFCIPLLQNCISGIPSRRDLIKTTTTSNSLCPRGLTACYLHNFASLAKGKSISWECMDTQNDIESCGGCLSPVTDQEAGADCTTMVGADSVAVSRVCGLRQVQTCSLLYFSIYSVLMELVKPCPAREGTSWTTKSASSTRSSDPFGFKKIERYHLCYNLANRYSPFG